MFTVKFILIALVGLISKVAAMTIDTPRNVVRCENVTLTFDGGEPPYSLEVTNGLRAAFPVVVEKINGIESSPFEYKVNGSEVRIGFILHSDDEKTAYSGNVIIAENDELTCK
ncbi:hypothetical protein E3P92_00465 [Wallemia ichthyophaga]|uniref:MD-2-related lipid-recognition domain-containing protein n=2 Tax=Wallemia ichthyophaga TaxID=245174 RepID=A0A4T0JFB0_WALIC|nr:uncharacterized protein J056_004254 [Wallemia ichthyophaga EXF-994]TIB03420.1 hypothetical protein E3P95_00598 [Wallemia ichthyophaga]EOR01468.1 hypothetical protein J056_004254 [Wallemia ichthyophaga EXF-994]TIB04216.1 hypothetical protein E3P94_00671 [Wallemia ichthyophaga]TIB13272.1 hypothetical protein E3P90_01709 [Wallemia ichthyophaga]TIB14979.1 hypothetical protein E3P93_01459 [Wallemia ichthyophaga]